MKKILHITPNFNYSCGRSKLVYLYLKYFSANNQYKVYFLTNGGDSLDRLEEFQELNIKLVDFSTGFKNILYRNSFYNSLKEYIEKNNIELIHTHHRFPEYISVQIAKELNIKTVTSVHSFVKGFRKISFQADKIICVSNSVADHLTRNYFVKPESLVVLHNPSEQLPEVSEKEKEELKEKLGVTAGKKILLFMGRINKVKGYDTLIKSFEIVKEKFNNVILLLSGSVEDKKFHKELFVNKDCIKTIPPSRKSYQLYSISDTIVLPSKIEPFPFVMLEAGMFKKPFIGGDTGGIHEFIEDGKNGILIEPGNHKQLAEKIIYLLNNPDRGKDLGENLYDKVKRNCDFNNYFSSVEKIYNSLLDSK